MDLLLIRHGAATPIIDAVDGVADPDLDATGRAQAARLARWLGGERIDGLVASPMRRAWQTAVAVSESTRLAIEAAPDLAEYDRNAARYIPPHLLPRDDAEYMAMVRSGTYLPETSTEPPEEFWDRCVAAVEAVIAAHPGGSVAVVTHGGVINAYTARILGLSRMLWFYPENTSITRIGAARTGQRSLLSLNETGHLVGVRDGRP